ncbi:multi-sensor hybrid histidine kinase [Rippkaea orientalis PCC 8801]|uniref:histidine kinase n=1 Tax=Rippkaea orientalis (strain PCC 8801 / RF-1) TaxID=41431 RepID=B7K0E1_RIPO1|nr:PAS domain S-box protein [Rippkaea orientalis]ACK67425.1 multi-sensor hybrid histidine kinase [Rippkaea orientalis PCC 8801]
MLRVNETEWRAIVNLTGVGIAQADLQTGRFLQVNPAFCRLTGYTEAELLTLTIDDLNHPDDRIFDQQRNLNLLQRGSYQSEKRYQRKDGSTVWVLATGDIIQDAQGQPIQAFVMVQDISDMKQRKAEPQQLELFLQTSEAKLSRILNSAIAAISSFRIYANRDWEYDYWSAGCEKIYGYPLEVYQDKYFWLSQVVPEDCEQKIIPLFEDFFAERDATVEYRFRHQDGSIRWFSSSYSSQKITEDCWIVTTVNYDITTRKQAEIDLEKTQKRLQQQLAEIETIYQSAPIGLCVLDTNLRFVRINQRLAEINGLPVEAHLGRTVREVLPQLADTAEQILGQILTTGEPLLNVEITGETPAYPDVQRTWLENFWPLKDRDRIIGISTLCQEITERKQAELALNQQIAKERLLLEITQAIYQTLDVRQILQTAVAQVQRCWDTDRVIIFQFDPDGSGTVVAESVKADYPAILGSEIHDPCFEKHYIEPYRQGRVSAIADFLTAQVEPCYQEFMAQFQVRGNLVVPILQREQLWGLLIAHQCSAPRQWQPSEIELLQQVALQLGIAIQQAKLYEKNAEQAAFIDVASDGIFVQDLTSRILFWSQGAERLYGWTAQEAIGKMAAELLLQDSVSELESSLQMTLKQGYWRGELHHLTQEKAEIIVESRWTLMRDAQGNPISILTVNTDITEKKLLEKQLFHAQRLESIGTLASGIAHDLNNILTPLLSISQLLQLKYSNLDESTLRLLQILTINTQRAANIVKQLLLFSSSTETEFSLISPSQLLEDVFKFLGETFPKSIEIEVGISPDLWLINGDPTQLYQVLMNLCVNARDAMPDGGQLTISAQNINIDQQYSYTNHQIKVGQYVVITIKDTGRGIPREILDRIFDPFFTTKPLSQGTGLGLSTALGIIKNHGGTIEVYSDPNNSRGTQFNIYLPISETIAVSETTTGQVIPSGQQELILVVDDEVSIGEITKTTLETYNYRAIAVDNSIDAIAYYAQHYQEIQIVLIDLLMPEIDGLTIMRALKRINPDVKLIVTTGLTTPENSKAAQSLGIKGFLPKPYTAETLLLMMAKVVS